MQGLLGATSETQGFLGTAPSAQQASEMQGFLGTTPSAQQASKMPGFLVTTPSVQQASEMQGFLGTTPSAQQASEMQGFLSTTPSSQQASEMQGCLGTTLSENPNTRRPKHHPASHHDAQERRTYVRNSIVPGTSDRRPVGTPYHGKDLARTPRADHSCTRSFNSLTSLGNGTHCIFLAFADRVWRA